MLIIFETCIKPNILEKQNKKYWERPMSKQKYEITYNFNPMKNREITFGRWLLTQMDFLLSTQFNNLLYAYFKWTNGCYIKLS